MLLCTRVRARGLIEHRRAETELRNKLRPAGRTHQCTPLLPAGPWVRARLRCSDRFRTATQSTLGMQWWARKAWSGATRPWRGWP
eukprot:193890-Pyramimonas_sp.AAC.1